MGISERKEREKEKRSSDIIDAAEKVFFSKGFDNSTVDEIAREAEISKGTVYLYFKNKEDLHYAIIVRALDKIKDLLISRINIQKNGAENLLEIGKAYVDFCNNYSDYFDAIVHFDSSRIEKVDEEKRGKILEKDSPLMLLAQVIESGIQDGSIRNEFKPLELAVTLWGQVSGLMEFIVLRKKVISLLGLNPDEMILNLFKVALYGIST